tara:strand:+ start:7923 stop:8378 length:456 start_codon:yes stop_codon:yes gene_type:complete
VRPIPKFKNDSERYDWEIDQRYNRMDELNRWLAADGIYTLGPPIPPSALVFTHEVATEAFKLATGRGYIAIRPVCEELKLSRPTVRRIFDRMPNLKVAYVTYPGTLAGTRWHCRMLHRDSVKHIKKNVDLWVKRSKRGGKKTTAETVCRNR